MPQCVFSYSSTVSNIVLFHPWQNVEEGIYTVSFDAVNDVKEMKDSCLDVKSLLNCSLHRIFHFPSLFASQGLTPHAQDTYETIGMKKWRDEWNSKADVLLYLNITYLALLWFLRYCEMWARTSIRFPFACVEFTGS